MDAHDAHVIVGGGLAGASAAAALRREGSDGRIVLAAEEPHMPYERPPLSKDFLRGERDVSSLLAKPADFYAGNDIELLTSTTVTEIDAERRIVSLEDGSRLPLRPSSPGHRVRGARRLTIPGGDLPGIHYLRTWKTAFPSARPRGRRAGGHRRRGLDRRRGRGLAPSARSRRRPRHAVGRPAPAGPRSRGRRRLPRSPCGPWCLDPSRCAGRSVPRRDPRRGRRDGGRPDHPRRPDRGRRRRETTDRAGRERRPHGR